MSKITISSEKQINLHQNHRERVKDRFVKYGLSNFMEHEILELLLFYAVPQVDTNPISHQLINKFKNLKNIFNADINDLISIPGIGMHSAILIKLIPELARLLNESKNDKLKYLNNQENSKEFAKRLFENVTNEEFYVICLDDSNGIINTHKETSGEFSKVEVQIRKITDHILKSRCSRIIIAHNHPFADAEPSDEDLVMTHKLYSSCILNDIDILDHIIYSPTKIYSFAETGMLKNIRNDILVLLNYGKNAYKSKQFRENTTPYVILK